MLHVEKIDDDKFIQKKTLAAIVAELTGEFVIPTKCDDIQHQNRMEYDEIIYFGAKADLEKDGKAAALSYVSMIDKYMYNNDRYAAKYIEDPECRLKRQLDPEKEFIVIYNGSNKLPKIIEIDKDEFSIQSLFYDMTLHAVYGTPKWGPRAKILLFDLKISSLVYMIPEKMDGK